jgi:hypothetical protein
MTLVGGHCAVAPPSIGSAAPVMKVASSLSRNAVKAAISAGPAARPVGFGASPEVVVGPGSEQSPAAIEALLTIAPPPAARIAGT